MDPRATQREGIMIVRACIRAGKEKETMKFGWDQGYSDLAFFFFFFSFPLIYCCGFYLLFLLLLSFSYFFPLGTWLVG